MAISRINLGTAPTGIGGDTNRSAFSKIDGNFGDRSNAASRTVGNKSGELVEMDASNGLTVKNQIGEATWQFRAFSLGQKNSELAGYSMYATFGGDIIDLKPRRCADIYAGFSLGWGTEFLSFGVGSKNRYNDNEALTAEKMRITDLYTDVYNGLRVTNVYNTTTASGANVFVETDGTLKRSTSSERYKTDIQPLVLSDDDYSNTLSINPIVYRSTAEGDNPKWHWLSFSAEKLAEKNPMLVLWEYTETIKDEVTGDFKTIELEKRRPAGLNINGLVAMLHATNIKQGKLIDDLTKRIEALEAKLAGER